jgi:hypothetical protein
MAQISRTYDDELYKAYLYADYLYRLLPKNPHEKVDLNKKIMLVNSKIYANETTAIKLDGRWSSFERRKSKISKETR